MKRNGQILRGPRRAPKLVILVGCAFLVGALGSLALHVEGATAAPIQRQIGAGNGGLAELASSPSCTCDTTTTSAPPPTTTTVPVVSTTTLPLSTTTTTAPAPVVATSSSPPVSAVPSALAFTGPGTLIKWIAVVGAILVLLGLAMLALSDAPWRARQGLAYLGAPPPGLHERDRRLPPWRSFFVTRTNPSESPPQIANQVPTNPLLLHPLRAWPVRYRVTLRRLIGPSSTVGVLTWLGKEKAIAVAIQADRQNERVESRLFDIGVEDLGPAPRSVDGSVETGSDLFDPMEF